MSRPRFLADQDLNEAIVSGVLRLEPTVEIADIIDNAATKLMKRRAAAENTQLRAVSDQVA